MVQQRKNILVAGKIKKGYLILYIFGVFYEYELQTFVVFCDISDLSHHIALVTEPLDVSSVVCKYNLQANNEDAMSLA